MRVHLATDHAGLELKNSIKTYLIDKGYDVMDHGAHDHDPLDDYPDFIFPCAKAVAGENGNDFAQLFTQLSEDTAPKEDL